MTNECEKEKLEATEQPQGSKRWELLATFSCSTLMLLVGTSLGWNSPSVEKLKVALNGTYSDYEIDEKLSTVSSMLPAGQTFAPIISYLVVDKIGRKNTILCCGIPLIVSWSITIFSEHDIPMLLLARFACGISVGIAFCVTAIYVGEVASDSTRGLANVILMTMMNVGFLLAFAIGPKLSIAATGFINFVITLGFLILFSCMPETPQFLVMQGHVGKAEHVLRQLRGRLDVSAEIQLIEAAVHTSRKVEDGGWAIGRVFGSRACLRGIYIIGVLSAALYFGGFIPILSFCETIMRRIDTSAEVYLMNILTAVVQLSSVPLTGLLIDRWGRKPLLALSGITSGLCCFVVAVYFYCKEYADLDVTAYSLVPTISIFLTVFAFNCGIVVVQAVLISEIFAPDTKALAVCIVTINGGFMNFVSSKSYLIIAESWDFGHTPLFFLFAIVCWAVTVITLYETPETKGKTFIEIYEKMNRSRSRKDNKSIVIDNNNDSDCKMKMLI